VNRLDRAGAIPARDATPMDDVPADERDADAAGETPCAGIVLAATKRAYSDRAIITRPPLSVTPIARRDTWLRIC